MTRLIAAGAASAPAAHALDFLILFQLLARHAANACAIEIGLLCLDTPQTAKLRHKVSKESSNEILFDRVKTYLFIPLLLPFRDQIRIGVPVLQQPVVELLGNGFLLVVQVVDVTRTWSRGLDVSMRLCGPPTAQVVNQKRWAGLTFAALPCGQCGFLIRLFSCPAKVWPRLLTFLARLLTQVHTYAGA